MNIIRISDPCAEPLKAAAMDALEATPVAAVVCLPGLDVERGLGMMGSETSLRNILTTVETSLSDSIPEIWRALEADDVKTANRLLHGIKGYLPIFCTDDLIKRVTQVELVSKTESAAVLHPLFAALAPLLASLLLEIRSFVAKV